MARHSRSPSPSGSRPFRRHDDRDRDQPSGRRGERNYNDKSSNYQNRDRNRDRERGDRGGFSGGYKGRERDNGYPKRPRRSASPPPRAARRDSRSPPPRSSRPRSRSRSRARDDDEDEERKRKEKEAEEKLKPNFGNSGLLAAATKTVQLTDGTSTVLKYHEPPEARKPMMGWRLYVFKGSEQVELLHINRQSAYLIGRDRAVCDIAVEHPSCSKQHAVIQHRSVKEKDEFGTLKTKIKPFIIDLESTNGTHVNDQQIPASRYYELMASDVIKFGDSTREYVLLHDDAS